MNFNRNQLESRFNNVFAAYNSNKPSANSQPQSQSFSNKCDILQQWLLRLPQTNSPISTRKSHDQKRSHFIHSNARSLRLKTSSNSSCNSSTSSEELHNASINVDWITRWLKKNALSSRASNYTEKSAAERQKDLVTQLLEKSLTGAQRKEQTVDKKRFKTELCRRCFGSGGRSCEYEDRCQFAHNFSELRLIQRHPKYKTEMCLAYQNFKKNPGSTNCAYGSRCHFIHDESQEEVASIRLRMELYRRYKAKYPSAEDVILSDVIEKLNILDL